MGDYVLVGGEQPASVSAMTESGTKLQVSWDEEYMDKKWWRKERRTRTVTKWIDAEEAEKITIEPVSMEAKEDLRVGAIVEKFLEAPKESRISLHVKWWSHIDWSCEMVALGQSIEVEKQGTPEMAIAKCFERFKQAAEVS